MGKNKQGAATKIRKPNGFLYFVFFALIFPVMKLMFRLKVDRSGFSPPDGPFVVLCNHASFMDFVTVMISLYPRKLNAVVAQKYFYYSPLDRFLPFMGCIPKTLFAPDPHSVMGILSVIKRGDNLLLFPEGRCTTGGGYMGIHKATAKLIKKLGVPVVSCFIEGAYTCMPFWRKGVRWGRQRASFATLFTAEDTQRLSADEINSLIDKRLSGSDRATAPERLHVNVEKNLVIGLENILYICPKCEAEFSLETFGNTIRCMVCGNAAVMDRFTRLSPVGDGICPPTVRDWNALQFSIEWKRLGFLSADDEIFRTSVFVRMNARPAKGLEICGQGMLVLTGLGWTYTGELFGETVKLFFPLESVPGIPFDPNDNFQIYAGGTIHAFRPVEGAQFCVKYATVGECAYWRFSPSIQVTPVHDSGLGMEKTEKISVDWFNKVKTLLPPGGNT